jgi:hypothetical protein
MAEKSLVNAEAETLGVGPELLLEGALADELELVLELELDDELPHADTARLAVIATAASTVLLLSKYTISLLLVRKQQPQTRQDRSATVTVIASDPTLGMRA